NVLVVVALQFRVSVDEGEDELLVLSLHNETPFSARFRCGVETETIWQVSRNTALWLLVHEGYLVNENARTGLAGRPRGALHELRLGRPEVEGRERHRIVTRRIAGETGGGEPRDGARARPVALGREETRPLAEDARERLGVRLDRVADERARAIDHPRERLGADRDRLAEAGDRAVTALVERRVDLALAGVEGGAEPS